jgi:hypothetical protein
VVKKPDNKPITEFRLGSCSYGDKTLKPDDGFFIALIKKAFETEVRSVDNENKVPKLWSIDSSQ